MLAFTGLFLQVCAFTASHLGFTGLSLQVHAFPSFSIQLKAQLKTQLNSPRLDSTRLNSTQLHKFKFVCPACMYSLYTQLLYAALPVQLVYAALPVQLA